MKRMLSILLFAVAAVTGAAQQIMYSNLEELAEERGDTVSILKVEKRAKKQIYLLGGADYRIEAVGNKGLSRYLRRRCYAVRVDTALYVNCRKMRYKKFRLGGWYAPAIQVGHSVFYSAQPVGQVASSTATRPGTVKLGGEVGDAIAASGLVNARVYYELDIRTGRSHFVGRQRVAELLEGYPDWQEEVMQETSDSAEVLGKYLRFLKSCCE